MEVAGHMTGAVDPVILMAEIDSAVMGMCKTFSGRLCSMVCISEYAATVVEICGYVVGTLGTGVILKIGFSPIGITSVSASFDVDGLRAETTSK